LFLKSTFKIVGFLLLGVQLCTCQVKTILKTQSEFVFIQNGQSLAPVILYENAPPRTVLVAKEFVAYIEKITGVKPELIIGNPSKIPQKAVWIGYQPNLKNIFPQVNFDLKQEEIILTANKNHLVILGRDKFDKSLPQVFVKGTMINNYQQEYGTINAIYTFLQDYLEVRWFFPRELGEDIITKNKLSFKPFLYRYEPQIKARSGLFINSRLARNQLNDAVDKWTQHNRTFYSSSDFNAGHPFVNWWDKYQKTNPGIFALTTHLTRDPISDPKYVKLCVSNTAIDALWLQEVEEQIKDNPYMKIFSTNENDDYGSGFCICYSCKKLDHGSIFDKDKNFSDRHLHFANRLALKLQKKYPAKNYKVLYQAYGPDRPLPLKEKPNQYVIISSVANFHTRRNSTDFLKNPSVIEYKNWNTISQEQFWRPNLGNPVGRQWGMPDIALNQTFEDFKWVANQGCTGIFFDSFQDHWATQGPNYYVAAQLAWNPYADKGVMLNDFYNRMYGKGSIPMRKFWELMEATRQSHYESHHPKHGRFFIYETYNTSFFEKAAKYIKEGLGACAGLENKKFKERIMFANQGLIFTKKIVEIRQQMNRFEKDLNNKEIALKIDNLWMEIDKLKIQMNPLAIDFRYVKYLKGHSKNGSYNGRMTGIVPNKPITKRILKEISQDSEGLD
jgi:hypothetical protein